MSIQLIAVDDAHALHEFTMLPFELYRGNSVWVPPLIAEYKKYVSGVNNNLKEAGPYILYIARKDGKTAGRILVGMDDHLNASKGLKDGYISQFECIEDYEVARNMLDAAVRWLREHGATRIKGPLSLPAGDDNRGFILDNFDSPVAVMDTYNKPYYNDFFVRYGFIKYYDCYAFTTQLDAVEVERYARLVPIAMKRYRFRLDTFDKSQIEREARDIKQVIERAMPPDWEDFAPLTDDDVGKVVKQLIQYIDPRMLFIARTDQNEPIGFNITLPDYNQVLRGMNGRLFPFGLLHFLLNRRKIDRLRTFVLFVVPEYRQKGVSSAIYLQTYLNAHKAGYKSIEGSTIWEYNMPMLKDILKLGIRRHKTYRIYQYDIDREYVFVYGSLKRGQWNHHHMEGCRFVGRASLPGYVIYDLGTYPGIVAAETVESVVDGEVFTVDAEKMVELDRLEDVGREYDRVSETVRMESGQELRAYIYRYGWDISDKTRLSRSWEGSPGKTRGA